MPTPSTEDSNIVPLHTSIDPLVRRSLHATCPPEDDRPIVPLSELEIVEADQEEDVLSEEKPEVPVAIHTPDFTATDELRDGTIPVAHQSKEGDLDMSRDIPSPTNVTENSKRDAPVCPIDSPPIALSPFASPFDSTRSPIIRVGDLHYKDTDLG